MMSLMSPSLSKRSCLLSRARRRIRQKKQRTDSQSLNGYIRRSLALWCPYVWPTSENERSSDLFISHFPDDSVSSVIPSVSSNPSPNMDAPSTPTKSSKVVAGATGGGVAKPERLNRMLSSAASIDLETVAEFPEDQPEEFANQVLSQMTRSYQQRTVGSVAARSVGASATSPSPSPPSFTARLSDEAVGTAVCSGVLTLVTVNNVAENKRLLVSVFKTTTELFMALYSLKCPGKTVACLNLKNFQVSKLSADTFGLQERGADAMLAFVFKCSTDDDPERWIQAASHVFPAPRRASLCQVTLPSVEEAPEFLGFSRPNLTAAAAASSAEEEDY